MDVLVVEAIAKGEWRDHLYTPGMPVDELLESIKTLYDLDEYVSDRLVIGFETYTANGNKKWKELGPLDVIEQIGMRVTKEGQRVPTTINDLELFVQQQQGDQVDEDVTCDSTFMLQMIPTIGQKLRAAFHWVPENQKIYLFMDNAGGHGTDVAIAQYTGILKNQFNVEIV